MLLRAGEVDPERAGLAGRHRHQVDLRPAEQPDRRLVVPRPITSSTTPRLANRSMSAAASSVSASRSRSPIVSRRRRNEPAGSIERRPGAPSRPATIVLISSSAFGSSSRRAGRLSSASIPARICCSVFAEMPLRPRSVPASAAWRRSSSVSTWSSLVDEADGLGPEARDREQLDEARRDLRPEALVVGHVAGRDELRDLVADRLADARDLRRLAGPVGRGEVDRAATDRVGGAVVGDGLERDLALDLEHVADLVEEPREVAVRRVVAALARRRRRRRPRRGSRDRRRRSGRAAAERASGSSGIVGRW